MVRGLVQQTDFPPNTYQGTAGLGHRPPRAARAQLALLRGWTKPGLA